MPDETAGPAPMEPEFRPEVEAKRLLRATRAGALATLTAAGDPFASLVTVATDPDGSPLILVSQLSAHTRHLGRDPRASLLLADTGAGDPLRHARLTVTGQAAQVVEPAARAAAKARFLARHPDAALYADFADFSFWRIAMEQVHLNGGFARAARFPAARILTAVAGAQPLLEAEAGALAHVNTDHSDTLALYARALAGETDGPWRATGIDPEGLDLACEERTARIAFPTRITTPAALRAALVALAEAARDATAR